MSDQTKTGDGVHENHWCEHPGCKRWGSFGFSRSKGDQPVWHCIEHYPERGMFKAAGPSPSAAR